MARVSAAQWRKRVEAWEASGKTAEAYGPPRGVDPKQLQWWKWKLGRDGRAQPREARPTFVPAHLAEEATSKVRGGLEVTFASGVVVRVPAGFSPRALADLIEAVGGLSC